MTWQLARPQSYRKLVIYRKKSPGKTGLHYKNDADSVRHTHKVLQRWNIQCLQEVGAVNEKTGGFNPTSKRWAYQLLIAIKIKLTFFDSRIKAKCLEIVCVFLLPRLIRTRVYRCLKVGVRCLISGSTVSRLTIIVLVIRWITDCWYLC